MTPDNVLWCIWLWNLMWECSNLFNEKTQGGNEFARTNSKWKDGGGCTSLKAYK